jgi:hypothetical protein
LINIQKHMSNMVQLLKMTLIVTCFLISEFYYYNVSGLNKIEEMK